MKETGIIMSGNHPKLILELKKTMTRRVINPQPDLLYGIYDDIIQLYHNRRAEDDRVDIKANTNITKRQLYGWERWQDLLTNQIQGLRQEGFCGVVSISRLQDGEEGVFSCFLMPRQQAGNDVSSSASMYGFSRHTPSKINAGEAFGWQPAKQQAIQSQVGDSIRELARQDTPQRKQSELQQSEFTNNASRERTYPLGSQEGHSQQKAHLQSIGNEPTFHIRNMPWSIGQRLWVRETFVLENDMEYGYSEEELAQWAKDRPVKTEDGGFEYGHYHLIPHYRATEPEPNIVPDYADDFDDKTRWSPSIFMPRWASRIERIIALLRVERLRDIFESDAKAEGGYTIEEFIKLFIKINHLPEDANPWNWVIGW